MNRIDRLTQKHLENSKQAITIWQKFTEKGNSKMRENFLEEAELFYSKAMTIAENLSQQAENLNRDPQTIHLYIIACHNLADLYENTGLTQRAESYLLKAHDRTLTIINNPNLDPDSRMEGYRGLQIVLRQLVNFYHRNENSEAIPRIFLESQQQAQKFVKD
jgi:tetratricopeptide (TPR) repeat protein